MTEGNMACEEAVRLLEKEVVILNDISHKILKIKKLQAKIFIKKVGEVLRILEMERTPSLPDQLMKKILPLALPVEDFVQGPRLLLVRSNVKHIIPSSYDYGDSGAEKVPEEIGLIENKLEKYLDKTDFYDVCDNFHNNLVLLPCREGVRNLLQASQELKEAINFFHLVVTESAVLCDWLCHLGALYANVRLGDLHGEVCQLEGMSNVVNRGLDAVRCPGKDRLSSQMGTFEEDVLLVSDHLMLCSDPSRKSRVRRKSRLRRKSLKEPNILLVEEKCFDDAWLDSGLINIKENCIEKQARKFFDGKNGMRLVLLDTLDKLHPFQVEAERIWKVHLEQIFSAN